MTSSTAADRDDDGPMRPDRVAEQADGRPEVGPVGHRVERPVEGGEEAHVEDFRTTSRPSTTPKATASTDRARGGESQGQGDERQVPRRDAHERDRASARLSWFGDDQGANQHEQHRRARWPTLRGDGHRRAGCGAVRDRGGRRDSHAPRGRTTRRAARARPTSAGDDHDGGQDVRRRDREHDALDRRDDLAPVARRQRRAQPRQQPAGRDERVARRADREHPRGRPSARRRR